MKAKPVALYPHMVEQWDFEKNKLRGLDINTTPGGLKVDADWKCKKCGYEWTAKISTRKESKGYCPNCDKDKQGPKTKSTISMVPHLFDYWDFDANPDIDPYTLTASKNAQANWKCPDCGHKWKANIHNRYYDKTGCPACAGKVATTTNNVLRSYPEIEKYYDFDFPDNPSLETLAKTSTTKVHWKCPDCGHRWTQRVVDRIRDGRVKECAICTGARISGSYAEEYPEAAVMYSKDNPTPFSELRAKDRTTIFKWKCNICGYEFESTLGSMLLIVNKPHKGCPQCLGKVVAPPGESFADIHPELIDQYDPANGIDPYTVLPSSRKSAIWHCKDCGHTWEAPFFQRHSGWGDCPVCNYRIGVRGVNTLEDKYPEIAGRWSPLNSADLNRILCDSKGWYLWDCKDCGQTYSATPFQMINGFTCPYCSERLVLPGVNSIADDKPEVAAMFDAEKNGRLPNAFFKRSQNTFWWKCKEGHSFCMSGLDLGDYIDLGEEPCPYCDGRRISEDKSLAALYPEYMKYWADAELPYQISPSSRAYLNWKCKEGHIYTLSPARFIELSQAGMETCPYCDDRKAIPGENSLAVLYPSIAAEWDYEKNKGFNNDPDMVRPASKALYYWKCSEGHSYKKSPSDRIADAADGTISCPYCAGKIPIAGENSLKALRPDWMEEWADSNFVDPDTIFVKYSQSVFWTCSAGHQYSRSPAMRLQDEAEGRESCPYCDGRLPIAGENSLKALRPDWMEEWADSNFVDPDTIFVTYSKYVSWNCSAGHQYSRSPAMRLQDEAEGRESCPYCDDRMPLKGDNTFFARHRDLVENEWLFVNNDPICHPDEILDNNSTVVWWQCTNESRHRYKMSPKMRLLFEERDLEPCNICRGYRRNKSRFYRKKKK